MSIFKPPRVFIVYEYVREKLLTDIIQGGGEPDTLILNGIPRLRAIAAHFVTSWQKAAYASGNFTSRAAINPLLREEFADIWEALTFTREALQSPPLTQGVLSQDNPGNLKFRALHRQWEELSQLLRQQDTLLNSQEELAPWQEAVEAQALLTTLSLRDHDRLEPFGLTFEQIRLEWAKRRKREGNLSQRFLREVTLPADGPLTKFFAAQFNEKIPD